MHSLDILSRNNYNVTTRQQYHDKQIGELLYLYAHILNTVLMLKKKPRVKNIVFKTTSSYIILRIGLNPIINNHSKSQIVCPYKQNNNNKKNVMTCYCKR